MDNSCNYASRLILPALPDMQKQLTIRINQDRNGFARNLQMTIVDDLTLAEFREKIRGRCRVYIDDLHFSTKRGKTIPEHQESTVKLSSVLPKMLEKENLMTGFKYFGKPAIQVVLIIYSILKIRTRLEITYSATFHT